MEREVCPRRGLHISVESIVQQLIMLLFGEEIGQDKQTCGATAEGKGWGGHNQEHYSGISAVSNLDIAKPTKL